MFVFNSQKITVVRRPKLNGVPGFHFGVRLPDGTVVDQGMDTGMRVCHPAMFSAGLPVETVREVPISEHVNVYQRLHRARFGMAPYDLLNWNCETFATWLAGEEPRSDQIRWVAVAAVVATVVVMASKA
jgi:hypothetical protein